MIIKIFFALLFRLILQIRCFTTICTLNDLDLLDTLKIIYVMHYLKYFKSIVPFQCQQNFQTLKISWWYAKFQSGFPQIYRRQPRQRTIAVFSFAEPSQTVQGHPIFFDGWLRLRRLHQAGSDMPQCNGAGGHGDEDHALEVETGFT